ncbi:hypothetical protein DL96DRAFT_1667781 [Flagelloscypha sp. PMI_526]|nr:hypothetical protein DL96DRAFT_1667781 [Flagelloscypha sp. PMI_526]
MTSKEKRQLRNKISARNFRTRRKEYITTLEGDIADRDKLLAAIRAELGTSQTENKALRAEIAALKRALLTGHPPSPSLLSSNVPAAPPSPAPTSSPEPGTKQQHTPPSSPLLMPNFAKDLPMAGPSTKPFWAGAGPAGFTPVHRTVLPEVNLERAFHSQRDGENINPMMNLRPQIQETFEKKPTFDQWSENHLFNLKNLDAYRMQLWQHMALRQQQQNQQPHLTGLAGSIRPHFFLGGLSARQQLLTPPSSPPVGGFKKLSTPSSSSSAPPSDAVLATLASQTLVRRLGGAFWDAFSGKEDGVKKLLEGKAKLELVDIEGPSVRPPTPARAVTLPTSRPTSAQPIAPVARPSEDGCMARILEESMRSLSLAGKK